MLPIGSQLVSVAFVFSEPSEQYVLKLFGVKQRTDCRLCESEVIGFEFHITPRFKIVRCCRYPLCFGCRLIVFHTERQREFGFVKTRSKLITIGKSIYRIHPSSDNPLNRSAIEVVNKLSELVCAALADGRCVLGVDHNRP